MVRLTPFVGDTPPEPGVDNPMQEDRVDLLLGGNMGIVVRAASVICVRHSLGAYSLLVWGMLQLYIRNAVGLNVPNIADIYCQFRFLDADQRRFISTPTCPYMTARPRFEFAETFHIKVTDEFCDYLREDRLDIKVGGVPRRRRGAAWGLLYAVDAAFRRGACA